MTRRKHKTLYEILDGCLIIGWTNRLGRAIKMMRRVYLDGGTNPRIVRWSWPKGKRRLTGFTYEPKWDRTVGQRPVEKT